MFLWWTFKAYNCLGASGKLKTSPSVINAQSKKTQKKKRKKKSQQNASFLQEQAQTKGLISSDVWVATPLLWGQLILRGQFHTHACSNVY